MAVPSHQSIHPTGSWAVQGRWNGPDRVCWSYHAVCIASLQGHAHTTGRATCGGAFLEVRAGTAKCTCLERHLATPCCSEALATFVSIVLHDLRHARATIWSKSNGNGPRAMPERARPVCSVRARHRLREGVGRCTIRVRYSTHTYMFSSAKSTANGNFHPHHHHLDARSTHKLTISPYRAEQNSLICITLI